jgi:DNA-binding transcriptional LysR family regulator
MNAAARSVHSSQPAVTQAIFKLEKQLGTQLFERRPDGVRPTSAALLLLPRIQTALGLIGSSRVTATQARAFVAFAKSGSYVVASAATGLSQPSLHRAVVDLEAALGVALVERRGRGLALTRRGQQVARSFRLAQVELEAGLSEVSCIGGAGPARIAIGAMPLSRAKFLPAAIVEFQKTYPEIQITIAEGAHAELIEPLRDGDLDFIVGASRTPSPGRDVVQTPLFQDHPVVVGRSGHPLAGVNAGKFDPEKLAMFGWIAPPEGAPLRDQWKRMFLEAGLPLPHIQVECGSVMMIRQLLIQTDCLTLLSPDQVAVELEARWLAQICPPPKWLLRNICLTTRADWRPTPPQANMLDVMNRLAAEMG